MTIFKKISLFILSITFIILMSLLPTKCQTGAANGIMLCGNVIIPSLFPFTVFVLLLMNLNIGEFLKPTEKITKTLFRLNSSQFAVFLLSLIGGFPVGAKLINKLFLDGFCDRDTAKRMLTFCVNGGPAFIVLAVGETLLGSKKIGYCLLAAHIVSSFLLLLFSRKHLNPDCRFAKSSSKDMSFSENFVSSVSDAANCVISICCYVILFSTINSYFSDAQSLKTVSMFFEVTNGVMLTKNIYAVAFLLGFCGISIWFQIISLTRDCGIDIPKFIIFRIVHGLLSCAVLFIILKIFPISVSTLSNNLSFSSKPFFTSAAVAVSLLLMTVIFIISVFSKNSSGNLKDDIV